MNNGQANPSNQPVVPPEFFPAGAGANDPEKSEPRKNNLSSIDETWEDNVQHDPRGLGERALQTNGAEESINNPMPTMPPGYETLDDEPTSPDSPKNASRADTTNPYFVDPSGIKTTDRISPSAFQAVDKITNQLEADGSASDFYKAARQLMVDNLKGSYADKSNWKGDK